MIDGSENLPQSKQLAEEVERIISEEIEGDGDYQGDLYVKMEVDRDSLEVDCWGGDPVKEVVVVATGTELQRIEGTSISTDMRLELNLTLTEDEDGSLHWEQIGEADWRLGGAILMAIDPLSPVHLFAVTNNYADDFYRQVEIQRIVQMVAETRGLDFEVNHPDKEERVLVVYIPDEQLRRVIRNLRKEFLAPDEGLVIDCRSHSQAALCEEYGMIGTTVLMEED